MAYFGAAVSGAGA